MHNVLILNTDMMPISLPNGTIDYQSAVRRVLAGFRQEENGCRVIYSSSRRIKTQVPLIDFDLEYWPSVIMRKKFLKRKTRVPYTRNNIYYRDEGRCRYCGISLTKHEAQLEHYIPKSRGGPANFENIVISCQNCNAAKDNQMPTGRWKLEKPPHVPEYWEIIQKKTYFPITIPDERWLEFIPPWNAEVIIRE